MVHSPAAIINPFRALTSQREAKRIPPALWARVVQGRVSVFTPLFSTRLLSTISAFNPLGRGLPLPLPLHWDLPP